MRILIVLLTFTFLLTPVRVIPSNLREINQPLAPGVFLVANPELIGPYFTKSVVLLVKYDYEGAMGVIINRPSGISLSDAIPDFKGLKKDFGTLFIGGPVSRFSPFILLRSKETLEGANHVFEDIFYSTYVKAVVDFILNKNSNDRARVYAGYSGWVPGQLEAEIARGSWKVMKGDQHTIFDKNPDLIWDELIRGDNPIFIKKWEKENSLG